MMIKEIIVFRMVSVLRVIDLVGRSIKLAPGSVVLESWYMGFFGQSSGFFGVYTRK